MPPTAESVLLQRKPVSGQNRITSQFLPHAPPSDRPSSSRYSRCVMRDTVKMRMKMTEDSEGELVNGSDSDVRFQFFYKEPCLYSHQTYNNASKIFSALRHESLEERENPYLKKRNKAALSERDIPQVYFSNDQDKRLAFELAFSTLKYQLLFEEILQDCAFFSTFPEFVEDSGLVMVMLCDFQGRKFQQRTPLPGETTLPDLLEIEQSILECKTHLNAALARHRIKAEAPSLDHLLPDTVRSKEELRSTMPVYGWVNHRKSNMSEVLDALKEDHYRLVSSDDALEGKMFCVDSLCHDVLMFSSECANDLVQNYLVTTGKLVLQDKSSSIAPHSVKYLVGEDADVIHVNVGSGMTTAHIASLLEADNHSHIWAFGAKNPTEVRDNMEKLGVKGVKVMTENFLDIEPDDNRFKNAKVILITADCSKSGIANPIDFIVNEGEDMKILKDLSIGDTGLSKLGDLTAKHTELLKHALKFSKVQAVVYTTRSIHDVENENVVSKAVEYINLVQQRKYPYRVVPPVIPFSSEAIDNKIGIHGKFIKFRPTEKTSGCFIAVVTREPEDSKEAAKDVLARAQAKGLLSGKKRNKTQVIEGDHENGEASNLVNGHTKSEKLLTRRSRRSEQKLPPRSAISAPHATSPVRSYIHSPLQARRSVPRPSGIAVGTRLYKDASKREPSVRRDKVLVAEHLKIVKHPAPFSQK
ncbi:putative methyltransferase NSUN7 [Saccostrea echinata]|uniref:putative methyltransferase NSUN7 n=1 Tax=Saccostrea echinata TaxID=191078 RepID=UPI002A82DA2C|nr:putative methyltransferase NSUN7 [Saccostrea echinata]XP_061188941.1 putative methyltransferase NSUN7 [Saccostrea echinata]